MPANNDFDIRVTVRLDPALWLSAALVAQDDDGMSNVIREALTRHVTDRGLAPTSDPRVMAERQARLRAS